MCGVADQKHPTVLHRFDHKAAQRRDAFFDGRSGHQIVRQLLRQTGFEFIPEALIGPVFDFFIGRNLQVVTSARRRTHAAQGKTAFVAGVDQLFVHRWSVGKNPQPAKRVDPFKHLQVLGGNRLPRHAMEAVAAGDVVAIEAIVFAVLFEGHERFVSFHAVGNDIARLVEGLRAGDLTSGHQVPGDLGLAVDHHGFAPGEGLQVDVHLAPVEGQFEATMNQSFGVHALAHTGLAQQLYHALFKHTGTDAPEYIIRRLAFENQGVDAGVVQQLSEQ
ncbi:hypothetical protein D3C87_1373780 [compost metagenome]